MLPIENSLQETGGICIAGRLATKMDRAIDRGEWWALPWSPAHNRHCHQLSHTSTKTASESPKHTRVDLTNGVLLGLVNTETGERGFLLTESDEFLRPYTDALPVIETRLAKLQELTRYNSELRARTQKLEEMTRARLALLKDRIDLRRRRARDVNILDAANKGKEQMDAVRALIADMEVAERAELETRNRLSTRAFHIAVVTGLLGAVAGLVFLGAFVVVLNRSLTSRQAAMHLLAQQSELFRTTLASIGDAVITTDNSARVTFQSHRRRMTGWVMKPPGQPWTRFSDSE